jgi:DNA-binding NarL/FixJ family response regulator
MPSTLIVDDDGDMRTLVRILIERANHGLEVAGEAASGEEALVVWRDRRPDVVVLDQQMPGLSGAEVAKIMLGEQPDQVIVLFTAYGNDLLSRGLESCGVRTIVPKQDWSKLVNTIRELVV